MEDWNRKQITAQGSKYTVWLNGDKDLDFDSPTAIEKGPIGFQVHRGWDMAIEFRNVMIA